MNDVKRYRVGSIRVDGIEPSEEFKLFAQKEAIGELTKESIDKFTSIPHKIKQETLDRI